MDGIIFNIQHFSAHDGPGVRTTVFFKGCNLRCFWCHNPESWEKKVQVQIFKHNCIGCGHCVADCPKAISGDTAIFTNDCLQCGVCVENCYTQARKTVGYYMTEEDLLTEIMRDVTIYQRSGGGVTFSGGEPLLQADFVSQLIKECRKKGVHTAIESAVCVPWENIEKCMPDLFFCDIKTLDNDKHKFATGQSNELILQNIQRISSETDVELIIRTPIIPGFNDNVADITAIGDFVSGLSRRHMIELLPFHGYCIGKYESLNMKYAAQDLKEPSKELMDELKSVLEKIGCYVKY